MYGSNIDLDPIKTQISTKEEPASKPEPQADKALSSSNKRRTWKKPKDKPKRSLTSYNIFFQYERARIIAGRTEDARPEEIMRDIEGILNNKNKEKRRHRKSHGLIGFQDLARTIADRWKTIDPKIKAIFVYYADVDTHRYRKELKIWREKRERVEGNAVSEEADERMNPRFAASMNTASASEDLSEHSFSNLNELFSEKALEDDSAKPGLDSTTSFFESFTSSSSSLDSEFPLEPSPLLLKSPPIEGQRPYQHSQQQQLLADAANPYRISGMGQSSRAETHASASYGLVSGEGSVEQSRMERDLLPAGMHMDCSISSSLNNPGYAYSNIMSSATSMPGIASGSIDHQSNGPPQASVAANPMHLPHQFSTIATTAAVHHRHGQQPTIFHSAAPSNVNDMMMPTYQNHSVDSNSRDRIGTGLFPPGNMNFIPHNDT